MSVMATQITGVLMVYLTVCSGADQRKHQSSAPLAFVRGSHPQCTTRRGCRRPGVKPLSEPMQEYFNRTPGNKHQWNFNRNQYIFIQEYAFEDVCEMAPILSRLIVAQLTIIVSIGSANYYESDGYRQFKPARYYGDVIMSVMASQITSLTIAYSTVFQAQIKENIKAPGQ